MASRDCVYPALGVVEPPEGLVKQPGQMCKFAGAHDAEHRCAICGPDRGRAARQGVLRRRKSPSHTPARRTYAFSGADMRRAHEPVALVDLAADAGLGLSDVAFTAGLDESTVSRLWADPGWLDRVTGASLQRIIAAVPGVAEYVTSYSLSARLGRLAADLAAEGLEVDENTLHGLPGRWHSGPVHSQRLAGRAAHRPRRRR